MRMDDGGLELFHRLQDLFAVRVDLMGHRVWIREIRPRDTDDLYFIFGTQCGNLVLDIGLRELWESTDDVDHPLTTFLGFKKEGQHHSYLQGPAEQSCMLQQSRLYFMVEFIKGGNGHPGRAVSV